MSTRHGEADRELAAVLRRLAAGDRETPSATVASACAWQAERASHRVRRAAVAAEPASRLERMLGVLVTEDEDVPSCAAVWLRGRRSTERAISDACGSAQHHVATTITAMSRIDAGHVLPEILVGGLLWSVEAGAATPAEAVRRALSLTGALSEHRVAA